MRVGIVGKAIVAFVVVLGITGTAVAAASVPLPDRNPQRVAGMPLPERNPIRDAGLPLPERNPMRIAPTETADASPPDVAHDEKPDEAPEAPDPTKWSDAEIAAERARCEGLLKDLPVVTELDDPIRKGECGAVAPVSLISVGKDPQVRLVPPATVTCDMVAAMAHWIEKDVQPAARKILGAPVTRMNIIGDYSCRNAVGRTSRRLSEHGLANALDIRDFVTENGKNADLKRDWGPTERDIAAWVAAQAAAEAARKAAAAAAAAAAEAAKKAAKQAAEKPGTKIAAAKEAERPQPAVVTTGSASAEASGRRLSRSEIRRARRAARQLGKASRLGAGSAAAGSGISPPGVGKKSAAAASSKTSEEDEKPSPQRLFLRDIHAKACGTFGTVLGPEANEAHRNHFHVDMAKRRHRSYCE